MSQPFPQKAPLWVRVLSVTVASIICLMMACIFSELVVRNEIGQPIVDAQVSMFTLTPKNKCVMFHSNKGDFETCDATVYERCKDRLGQTVQVRVFWQGGFATRIGWFPGRYEFAALASP